MHLSYYGNAQTTVSVTTAVSSGILSSYSLCYFLAPSQKTSREFQVFCHKAHNGEPLISNLINVDITLTESGKKVKSAALDAIIRRHQAEILREYELIQSDGEGQCNHEEAVDNSPSDNVNLTEDEAV